MGFKMLPTQGRSIHKKAKDKLCNHCDFATSYATCLAKHIKVVHARTKDNPCSLCAYTTVDRGYLKAHIKAIHRTDPDRIVTIPRGVDFAAFDPAAVPPDRISELKAGWQIEDGDDRLVFVLPGRLTSWKGQSLAIDALGALDAAERTKVHLVLAGDDQGRKGYVTELEDKIIAHKLGGTVSIVGHTSDMPAAYMAADVVLAPSTRPEAFGRVAAEASAMAKPVIVADHGGQRETVVEGQTGTRAEPGSVAALTACIRTLLNLRAEARTAMGLAGQTYVRERFSKKQLQTATLNVYARLLLK